MYKYYDQNLRIKIKLELRYIMTITQEKQECSNSLEDLWYFWNHCFYNRVKPSRAIKITRGGRRDVICHDCGKLILANEMRRKVRSYAKGRKKSEIPVSAEGSSYVCKHCHGIRRDIMMKEKKAYGEEQAKKFLNSVEQFDDLMDDCKFGTCDIFSAHHELFKDDPNRLKTDFLIGLVCGEEKRKEYLKTLKEEQ